MRDLLKIFILEDERIQQSRIEKVIKELISRKSLSCKATEIFGNAGQLLTAITERGSHQLFFLDIEIRGEEKKGLDIAKEIRSRDPNDTIVFVTTHSEFMPITFRYKVSALDFIDKALDEEHFSERVESAIEYTLEKLGATVSEDSFSFETAMARVQVPFHKILYFESSPTVHKVILHTKEERIEFYAGLSDLEKADSRLYQCHRSFVVNPENIVKIDKEEKMAIFENQESCLISRMKYRGLLERMKSMKQ
ncbi:response regulator transcription factor [Oribacterium sinus]|uniref:response regulator transcription factor n=1 Tax=Oribacterium sinus TaxID=237576 RepID=UPI002FE6E886